MTEGAGAEATSLETSGSVAAATAAATAAPAAASAADPLAARFICTTVVQIGVAVREQHTQEFQRWVSGCVVLQAFSSRARFICTTVVQIGVAI